MTVPFIFVVGSLGNYLEFLGYGTFFINALGINVLRGIIRNYAELFSFFELGGIPLLRSGRRTWRNVSSRLADSIEPGRS